MGLEDLGSSSSGCIITSNPVVNMPTGVITNEIRQVTLPRKSNFGTIERILGPDYEEAYFGDAFFLNNDISTSGCSGIPADGMYSNILGEMNSGEQVWYAGHVETDENTLDNPIADAGATMSVIADFYSTGGNPDAVRKYGCPVAPKSFLNSEFDSCVQYIQMLSPKISLMFA